MTSALSFTDTVEGETPMSSRNDFVILKRLNWQGVLRRDL